MAGGRQREFDRDQALEDAMLVFWQKGFLGASLSDLTAGMGINKPSLYATFGNKEQLFIQATERYVERYAKPPARVLAAPGQSFEQRLKAYLMSVVAAQCDRGRPKGCYISLCVGEAASDCMPQHARHAIAQARDGGERCLAAFFREERGKGNLAADAEPEALALFFITLLHGTAAMARAGKSLVELETVVDQAMRANNTLFSC